MTATGQTAAAGRVSASGPAAAVPGVVALGDSITRGDGAPALGVHCCSWAQWLARTLDLPFHGLAWDGAVTDDVVGEQLPRLRGAYALAAVYVGVNDVRAVDFDADRFTAALAMTLERVAAHADGLVVCTIPLDLGRPRAGAAKVGAANAIIRALAADHAAAVADLSDLHGSTLVLPDAVHPTAVGQLEIADRAARALGLPTVPSAGVQVQRSVRALARFAVCSHTPALARDARRRAVEALQRRVSGRDHRTAAGSVAAPMTTPPPCDRLQDEPLADAAPPAGRPPAGLVARARARWSVARSRGRVTAVRGAALGRGVIWDLSPGARVRLGGGCSIGERTRVRVVGDGTVRVGAGAVLGERCVVQARTAVTVGAGARLADEVVLLDHRPVTADPELPMRRQGVTAAPIIIGDRARIGPRTVIGAGVTVGPDAQVGANLVIEADVPAGARVDGPDTPRVAPAG